MQCVQLRFKHFVDFVLWRVLRARSFGVVMHEVVSGRAPERRALPPLGHAPGSPYMSASANASLYPV